MGASAAAGPATQPLSLGPMTDLSLREAAQYYDLSVRTLGQRIRNGEIEAYKNEGDNRGQWRVSRRALERFGYRLRTATPAQRVHETADRSTVRKLERELASARRAESSQRSRAEQTDRRLGEALMEIGRLRAALAAETNRPA